MKYGFVGCGNMGSSLVRALSKSTKDIAIADFSEKAKEFARELELAHVDNETLVKNCDRIFLAVKPHILASCLAPLKNILAEKKPLLISMAAGVEIAQIEAMVGVKLPVIRIMPNTPTAVGKGVILYCRNDLVDDAALADWLSDMAPCGIVDALPESLIDAASALSGSGPAYMYLLIEALADGAVACGLPRDKAMVYAAATMEGAARMFLTSSQHPGALKDAVCSPGGTTIAGVRVLESKGFRSAAMECVVAAYQKNKELGK